MTLRFKRQDFIDGIPGAAAQRFCSEYNDAWDHIAAAWRDRHEYRRFVTTIYAHRRFVTAISRLSPTWPSPTRAWLSQITCKSLARRRGGGMLVGYLEAPATAIHSVASRMQRRMSIRLYDRGLAQLSGADQHLIRRITQGLQR